MNSLQNLFCKLHMKEVCFIIKTPAITVQNARLHKFSLPKKYEYELPPDTRGKKLAPLPKVPQFPPQQKPFHWQRRLMFMRGPEPTHNFLLHKQYGIMALIGGRLKHGHFEMIRLTCGRKLPKSAFALWRVNAVWQSMTKKGVGIRQGGGKGSIDHYVTPIKAGRIIIEVGGPFEYIEVRHILEEIASKLPFKAMAVSQEILYQMKRDEELHEKRNENPYTMKYIMQNNLGGIWNWAGPYDKEYFGKHR